MMSIHEYMSTPRSKHGGRGTHTRHVRPSSPVRSPSPKAATPCLLPHHVQHHPCATTLTPEHLRHCYGGNVGTETISATRTRTAAHGAGAGAPSAAGAGAPSAAGAAHSLPCFEM